MHNTLAYLVTLLRRDFSEFCNYRLQELGISQGLLFFIVYIGKHPGCSPGNISTDLNYDTGYTTRSIDKLVQTNFVVREKSEKDKRVFILKLSEKGELAFKESHDLFYKWDNELLKNISENDKETLFRIINEIVIKKDEVSVCNNKKEC